MSVIVELATRMLPLKYCRKQKDELKTRLKYIVSPNPRRALPCKECILEFVPFQNENVRVTGYECEYSYSRNDIGRQECCYTDSYCHSADVISQPCCCICQVEGILYYIYVSLTYLHPTYTKADTSGHAHPVKQRKLTNQRKFKYEIATPIHDINDESNVLSLCDLIFSTSGFF